MAKTGGKQSIIGAVGGILIGSAILLFVVSLVLNNLSSAAYPRTGVTAAQATDWASLNSTIAQLKTFMTICSILLGVLGIVLIGSTIIGTIGGGFGG